MEMFVVCANRVSKYASHASVLLSIQKANTSDLRSIHQCIFLQRCSCAPEINSKVEETPENVVNDCDDIYYREKDTQDEEAHLDEGRDMRRFDRSSSPKQQLF